jgi:hypothetical protein
MHPWTSRVCTDDEGSRDSGRGVNPEVGMHRHLVGRGRTIWQAEVIDENHWIRVEKGRKEFFVKWVGLPITRCEWKLPQDIEHAREKIEAFELELSARAPGKRKGQDGGGAASRKKRAN